MLIDTGGYKLEADEIERLVTDKSLATIARANLILLLVDVTEETPEDQEFIERLRPFSEKIVLVVNKVDNPERWNVAFNYHSLGFERTVFISASHGRGVPELRELIAELLLDGQAQDGTASDEKGILESRTEEAIETEKAEESVGDGGEAAAEEMIALAVLGKPNTGKSTLVNRLLGVDRSIVSDIPGTTRDVLEGTFTYRDCRFRIMDTAGIRRRSRVGENIEYYSVNRALGCIKESQVVILMIDSLDGITDQDKKIAAQVVKYGRGIILALNKWDLQDGVPNLFAAVSDRVRFLFPVLDFAPIAPISALSGDGCGKLLDAVIRVRQQLRRRIETAVLNQAVKKWVDRYEQDRMYKIRYVTQVQTDPVKFVVFVNKKRRFPRHYIGYIKNRIRSEFGMNAIPIRIDIRES